MKFVEIEEKQGERTWAGVAMSFGESKMSKKGGVSESLGLLSRVSGETAATEASLDRKGSLGLSGGKRILEALISLKRHRLRNDEQGKEEEEAIGAPKQLAMDSMYALSVRSMDEFLFLFLSSEMFDNRIGNIQIKALC